jgi:FkbM family methyltransferase
MSLFSSDRVSHGVRAVARSRRPARTFFRLGFSLVRRRFSPLQAPVVRYEQAECDIVADLTTAVGLGLYRYGRFDLDVEIVRRLLQAGDTFVDGGANIGVFTLAAATRVGPSGCVIAFEPAPWARKALLRNIALNRFHWVRVDASALGESRTKAPFLALPGAGAGLSSLTPDATDERGEWLTVDVAPLDEAVPPELRGRLSVMKLDLEGAEHQALLGAQKILREAQPDLVLEVSDENLRRAGSSQTMLLRLLRAAGYSAYVPYAQPDGGVGLMALDEAPTARPSPNLFFSGQPAQVAAKGVAILRRGERTDIDP